MDKTIGEARIYSVPNDKKSEVWNYMASLPKRERPQGCTDKRLSKVCDHVFVNEDFWDDIVFRHGIQFKTLEKLKEEDQETYDHCTGNFWGMLMEIMWRNKIIK